MQSQSPTPQLVETRQPRIRRPLVRMTYDVPGQPSFYPGVTKYVYGFNWTKSASNVVRHATSPPTTLVLSTVWISNDACVPS